MPFLSFANPAGLWFLPLAGLPLLIHLFRRRRAGVIPFPDIRLLQQVQNAAVRPSRIREYLLLAVRTLIIVLLALSLARPAVNLDLPGWLSGSLQTCALVIDNSASMGAVSRDTTMLERAKQRARQVLKGLGPNARAAVVSAVPGSPVVCGLSAALTAERAVAALPQTELGTDLEGSIQTAARILEAAGVSGVRIIVFSDLQRTAFGPSLSPLGKLPGAPPVTVYQIKPSRSLNNLIWEKIQVKPLIKKIIVRARTLGGQTPQIGLAAGGKTIYQASSRPAPDGTISLSFGLPDRDSLFLYTSGDDLPLDDKYYLAAAVTGIKKVLLFSDDTDNGGEHLYRAFAAMARAGYEIKRANIWNSQYSKGFDLVVVAKATINKALLAGIMNSVHNGAGLLVAPPLNSDREQYQELLKQFSDITLSGLADSLSHNLYRLNKTGSDEGILSDLSPAELEAVKIKTYWKAFTRQNTVLAINRSDPALIFGTGQKFKTAVLLTGGQTGFGDMVFKPAFLVMLLQTADHLTQKTGRQSVTGSEGTSSGGNPGARQGSGWAQTEEGVPEALNIAAEESDLTPVSNQELKAIMQNITWQSSGSGPGAFPAQSPAARLFLFLAGLMLILEMALRTAPKI
ncbi:BatA domain-containing protein [candidate division TA06 bacterium]|nr:BatA domain-containing protein [candidate division TA06 bacterium]